MKTTNLKSLLVTVALLLISLQGFSQNYPGLRIDVVGATSSDQMWVFYDPICTRGFDNGYDGYKMTGTAATQIYAAEAAGNFQVDAIPDFNKTYIAFKAGSDTQYTMTFISEYFSTTYTGLSLVDSIANNTVNIFTSGATYTFTATNTAVAVKRFKLVATVTPPPPPPVVHKITITNAAKIVTVKNTDSSTGILSIYLASTGKIQKTYSFNANSTTSFSTGLKAGTYLVTGVTPTDNVSLTMIIH